jgi:hypothetical protein
MRAPESARKTPSPPRLPANTRGGAPSSAVPSMRRPCPFALSPARAVHEAVGAAASKVHRKGARGALRSSMRTRRVLPGWASV